MYADNSVLHGLSRVMGQEALSVQTMRAFMEQVPGGRAAMFSADLENP